VQLSADARRRELAAADLDAGAGDERERAHEDLLEPAPLLGDPHLAAAVERPRRRAASRAAG